jgi:hypothetical protein
MSQFKKFRTLALAQEMYKFVQENLDALEPDLRAEAQAILDQGTTALAASSSSGTINWSAVLAFMAALAPIIEQLIVIFNPPKPTAG